MVSRGASTPLKPSSGVRDSSIAFICAFRRTAVVSEAQMTVQYCITLLRGPSLWWDSTPVHPPASGLLPRSHLQYYTRTFDPRCQTAETVYARQNKVPLSVCAPTSDVRTC